MSQADLAAALSQGLTGIHMHQQTVAKIEKGTRPLRYMEAVEIAQLLTVDVYDLSAGHDEAVSTAIQMQAQHELGRMHDELDDFAEQLAKRLVGLALAIRTVAVTRNQAESNKETQPADQQEARRFERDALDTLEIDWGRDLNVAIDHAMRRYPYLAEMAEMRSEFATATYAELLLRVSESSIIGTEIDEELAGHQV